MKKLFLTLSLLTLAACNSNYNSSGQNQRGAGGNGGGSGGGQSGTLFRLQNNMVDRFEPATKTFSNLLSHGDNSWNIDSCEFVDERQKDLFYFSQYNSSGKDILEFNNLTGTIAVKSIPAYSFNTIQSGNVAILSAGGSDEDLVYVNGAAGVPVNNYYGISSLPVNGSNAYFYSLGKGYFFLQPYSANQIVLLKTFPTPGYSILPLAPGGSMYLVRKTDNSALMVAYESGGQKFFHINYASGQITTINFTADIVFDNSASYQGNYLISLGDFTGNEIKFIKIDDLSGVATTLATLAPPASSRPEDVLNSLYVKSQTSSDYTHLIYSGSFYQNMDVTLYELKSGVMKTSTYSAVDTYVPIFLSLNVKPYVFEPSIGLRELDTTGANAVLTGTNALQNQIIETLCTANGEEPVCALTLDTVQHAPLSSTINPTRSTNNSLLVSYTLNGAYFQSLVLIEANGMSAMPYNQNNLDILKMLFFNVPSIPFWGCA